MGIYAIMHFCFLMGNLDYRTIFYCFFFNASQVLISVLEKRNLSFIIIIIICLKRINKNKNNIFVPEFFY